jgi:hypothetical protein
MSKIITMNETGHEYVVDRGPWTSRLERALIMADVFGDMVIIEPTGGQHDKTSSRTMVRQMRQESKVFDSVLGLVGSRQERARNRNETSRVSM